MERPVEEILNSAFESAKRYETENGNCAQCVIAAVFEALGIKNDDIFRAATGFADGVGLTGDGHCGALSGGTMAIGYLFGRKKEDFVNHGKMIKSFILSKKLHDDFIEKYGSCRCNDIQMKLVGRSFNFLDPAEVEAAVKAGLPDKCSTLTGEVARLTTKIILDERERESLKGKEKKP
jgi:C_GCAxxG_C_C family probable redox protein